MRIVITGGPRTGKTELVKRYVVVYHTDDYMHLEWSEASKAVMQWFYNTGPWIVEGVAAVRALRKWLEANPTGKPCDLLVVLDHEYEELTKEQRTMCKGLFTVLAEIAPELRARGVVISGPVQYVG